MYNKNCIFVVEACKPTLWFDCPSFLNVAALMFVTQGYFAVITFVRNPCMVLDRKLKSRYPEESMGSKNFLKHGNFLEEHQNGSSIYEFSCHG